MSGVAAWRPSAVGEALERRLLAERRVAAGLFRGLRLPDGEAHGSQFMPKLMGCYELEIGPVLRRLLARGWPSVINAGAGDGYYACGCARALPGARVVAFEAVESEHALIAETARLNEVAERVETRGACDAEGLARLLEERPESLVIMDVEGFEDDLLDERVARACGKAALLVELHERERPGLHGRLAERFGGSHRLHSIPTVRRTVWNLPYPLLPVRLYLRHHLVKHAEEWRGGPMRWLVMEPGAR